MICGNPFVFPQIILSLSFVQAEITLDHRSGCIIQGDESFIGNIAAIFPVSNDADVLRIASPAVEDFKYT